LLNDISNELLEKETLSGEEFMAIVYNKYPELKVEREKKEAEKKELEKIEKEKRERKRNGEAIQDLVLESNLEDNIPELANDSVIDNATKL
jgi:cell division protease FtsH